MNFKEQAFGVEIELTGITRRQAASALADFFGTRISHVRSSYNTHEVFDEHGRIWKVMSDSSIRAEAKLQGRRVSAGEEYRVEVVTPILNYGDIEVLQEILRALRRAGAFANSSCGIHIHVDAAAQTAKTLRNLTNMMAAKEDLLYRALNVSQNRASTYCRKTDKRMLEKLNKKRPASRKDFECVWYGTAFTERCHNHYNNTRYHGLNLHATWTKGTVEYRLFNSTTHAGELKAYVQFCLAFTAHAMNVSRCTAKPAAEGNDRFAMRTLLTRLGLNGDEFKTCRHHMTKNLEGNSAWRYAA